MNNVDQVYLINLDNRKDRLEVSKKQLKQHKIKFKRIAAVDGNLIAEPDKAIADFLQKKYWNRYALGLVKTMAIILNDAIENNYNEIVVFEDDNNYDKNFTKLFNKYKKELPENWELVKLSAGRFKNASYHSKNVFQINESAGTFGMLIKKTAFKKVLEECQRERAPLDIIFNICVPTHHCFYPGLVVPLDNFSNITNEFSTYASYIPYYKNHVMEHLIQQNIPLSERMLNFM